MSTQTVKKVLEQRLIRGTPVIVADSFGKAAMRSKKVIVASKGPVKCNGKGRCAGDWCPGLAVFVTNPESAKEEKEMGWRGGTTKVCLTHLKDEDGNLVVAPPSLRAARKKTTSARGDVQEGVVTWEDLANTVADGDFNALTQLARSLKRENESLKTQVIEAQAELIGSLRKR